RSRRRCISLPTASWRTGRRVAIVAAFVEILVLAAGTTSTAASSSTAAFRAHHLHPFANHAQLRSLLAVLFPSVVLQPTLDQDRRAFAEVFAGDFRGPAPQGDIHKRRFLDPFAVLSLAAVIDGHANVSDRSAALQITNFDVAG